VIACQAVVSVWMISGAHYSIMTDKELDFSDKQHEAALQALIKGGAVEVVLDENGYRELRLTKIGEAYAQHASLASAGVNKKGSRFFWTPDSSS